MVLELQNNTAFSCERLPMQEINGANILRIVLKAAYQITLDGQLVLASEQPKIIMEDQYWGKPGASAVRYESDITLVKPFTDLVVNGHAYAPEGRPVREMDVSISYKGRHIKRLRVFGERIWKKGLIGWKKSTPEPFPKMPITYDRAYGGSDEKGSEPRNRSGTGYATKRDNAFKGTRVANIEFRNQLIKSPKDKPVPAGLGVISKHWQPRLSFAGTYDEDWLKNRFPLLPTDFDMRFNQSVAQDQWLDRPQGGEAIEVMGMTPDGTLHFSLPPCQVDLVLHYRDHKEEKNMDLDTILIEPDERQLTLTWRGSADIHGDPFCLVRMAVGKIAKGELAEDCGCR